MSLNIQETLALMDLTRREKEQVLEKLTEKVGFLELHLNDIEYVKVPNKWQVVGREVNLLNYFIKKHNMSRGTMADETINEFFETDMKTSIACLINKGLIEQHGNRFQLKSSKFV